jgi:23S rRNA (cytidine1920-2'-O)/16S rRNA (cytidine1409-2'-O)-methyltransferase
MMGAVTALWRALLDRGLARSEAEARALVMAGKVLVDDRRLDKAGARIAPDAAIRLRGVKAYASRGGEKLHAALDRLAIAVPGRVALDAGASTGGFTDCLLAHGAARVYAVDVGYGQLVGRLRQDPRVVVMERTNLAEVPTALEPRPTLVTLDLSYLPLATAWRIVARWLPAGGDVVSLVKPLFEVDNAEARRTGRIPAACEYVALLERLLADTAAMGWSAAGLIASPVRGSRGTLEFFLHARRAPPATTPTHLPPPAAVVAEALSAAGEAASRPEAPHPQDR